MKKIVIWLSALRHVLWRRIILTVLESFGILWLVLEIGSFFFPSIEQAVRPYWWAFLMAGLLVGLFRGRPRLTMSYRVGGTDTTVEIRVCDMFDQPGALVVTSNTTFDTSIEDGIISAKSTQGQFTTRYCDSVAQLDSSIEDSLAGVALEKELTSDEKPYGKRKKYPVGTVASVTCSGRRAYLVAISSLNAYRVASATKQDVLDALPQLWEYVRSRGELTTICCPIIGSGFSRTDATREDLVREIVRSFVAAARTGRFCEHITVAISSADFRRGTVDMKQLARFVEYACTFGVAVPESSAIQGTPLN